MWLDNLINSGSLPVVQKVAAFTEARHQVLAENIANIDTPNYRTKQLDPKLFQAKLAEAIEDRGGDPRKHLRIGTTRQFHTDDQGMLRVTPTLKPPENILFHDGTNASIERQMASLAENTLMHQVSIALIQERLMVLRKAIAGRL